PRLHGPVAPRAADALHPGDGRSHRRGRPRRPAVKLEDLFVYLAAFVRAAAFLYAFPLTGDRTVPAPRRVAPPALLAPALRPTRRADDVVATLPAEAILGFAAGFAGRVVYGGIEAGGQLIGLSLGLGFAGFFDASAAEEELPPRRLIRTLASLIF